MLQLKISEFQFECGTDEAGRGCLAGPVTAAAVILPNDFSHPWLTDSKQLSAKKRIALKTIIEKEAISFAFTHVMMEEIDQLNILNASILAMHRSIEQLSPSAQFIAVDGNRFKPFGKTPYETVVKGDGKFLHIAAASIIAKTERDAFMAKIDEEYPAYQWKQNKGYPTAAHREAIKKYGPTPYHRKSFRLLPGQLVLPL
ncbi:ribonuclease HII [Rasiella rasia]|uniref:Ribonuclease HII n=1 Tax=Rasiella rasia TaxID=2744027 RepID=A0A6G6GPF3_9FLAO|nr:ribonuclease HII [Rasiella rasia]QIE60313.1 ribonuclease HII [Rasiella rasia]